MKQVLLDTGPVTAYIEGRQGALDQISFWLTHDAAVTSILVYGEIHEHYLGQHNYLERRQRLKEFMRDVPPLRLTYRILERYGQLRRHMRRPYGTGTIGDIDTLIAATALERDLTIVTADRDFMRVPDLKVVLLLRETLRR